MARSKASHSLFLTQDCGTFGVNPVRREIAMNLHRILVLLLLTLVTFVGSSAEGSAQIILLGRYGGWEAFGGKADGGGDVCGASSEGSEGRSFNVKWYAGTRYLAIQIFKAGWQIPTGTPVDVILQFDTAAPWSAKALPFNGGKALQLEVRLAQVDTFINEIRYAVRMTVTFPDGSEAPWIGSMVGSDLAMQAMVGCIRTVSGSGAPQTQPFAQPQPTQPFGAAPEPARPPVQSVPPPTSQPALPAPVKSYPPAPHYL